MEWLIIAGSALVIAAALALYIRHERRREATMTPAEREQDRLDQQTW